jgi:stage V sporulation protein AE
VDYIISFLVGGIICVLAQILMDTTKLLPGRVMVALVCTGVILGALGLYKPLLDFAGVGASVPLTGFGYNLWLGIKEGIDEDGILGLFRGGFKMAAVGTSAALIFSYIASLIFQPKMTKN